MEAPFPSTYALIGWPLVAQKIQLQQKKRALNEISNILLMSKLLAIDRLHY